MDGRCLMIGPQRMRILLAATVAIAATIVSVPASAEVEQAAPSEAVVSTPAPEGDGTPAVSTEVARASAEIPTRPAARRAKRVRTAAVRPSRPAGSGTNPALPRVSALACGSMLCGNRFIVLGVGY